nr:terminase family protein [Sphingomonas rhizophila]
MIVDIPLHQVLRFASLGERAARRELSSLTPRVILDIDAMFETWAQRGQISPGDAGWQCWLMMAGRGFGKTRAGAEWIHKLAMSGPKRRIALVGATIDEARSVMVEGQSGLLSVAARHGSRVIWEPSKRQLRWSNGSVAELYSGESPDGLRGPQFHFAWCDELAKWGEAEEAWANLDMGMRLGDRPRVLVTTTPRSMPLLEQIRARPWTVETGGRTDQNISLPDRFIDVMMASYAGSRRGRQELNGELMTEAEGSLFPRDLIERARIGSAPEAFDKVVVGVDPPAGPSTSSGQARGGDACGIVVAGRSAGKSYVLADCSVRGLSPEGWARAVAAAAREWNACLVVAEANQGGAMVESVLKAADAGLPVRLVHASRGKAARAEPVATRVAVGKVWFAGCFRSWRRN